MLSVKESIFVNVSQEKAFNKCHDYDLRSHWDPFIQKSKIIEWNDESKVVWVKDKRGLQMTVGYTSFNPPKNTSMKMVKGPFFFKIFSGAWIFQKLGEQETKVTFSYSFKLKTWMFPILSNKIVIYFLKRDIKERILALKVYLIESK